MGDLGAGTHTADFVSDADETPVLVFAALALLGVLFLLFVGCLSVFGPPLMCIAHGVRKRRGHWYVRVNTQTLLVIPSIVVRMDVCIPPGRLEEKTLPARVTLETLFRFLFLFLCFMFLYQVVFFVLCVFLSRVCCQPVLKLGTSVTPECGCKLCNILYVA